MPRNAEASLHHVMLALACLVPHAVGCTCSASPSERSRRAASQSEIARFAESSNRLGLAVYARLAASEEANLVLSPAGVALALTLVEVGGGDATREDLLAALYDGGDEDALYAAVNAGLTRPGLASTSEVVLRADLEALEPFVSTVEGRFGTRVVTEGPDGTGGDFDAALGGSMAAAVISHARFSGRWVHPLSHRVVALAPFAGFNGERLRVPTMWVRARLRGAVLPGVVVVEMPYEGGDFSMLLVRANEQHTLAHELTPSVLSSWVAHLEPMEIEVSLPRFVVGPQVHRLNRALAEAGVGRMFDSQQADLSRLARSTRPLAVASVVQGAHIAVDEYGTRAESTTFVGVTDASGEPELSVRFDRPFLFILRDNNTGLVAFLGRVGDPRVGVSQEPR